MTSLVHFMYVAEGFMEDCDMLVRSLTEKYETVDWPKFCEQWKELQFDIIFYGRLSGAELVEFTEECLQCGRLYMVTETDNFEEQVIGVFIVYAITIAQPYKNLCYLRLTPEDVAPLRRVEAICRRDNRTDVLMMLGRLYVYSTHYHVCTRERAMDVSIRKYFDDSTKVPKSIPRKWHGELNRQCVRRWEDIENEEQKYLQNKNRSKAVTELDYPGVKVLVDTCKPEAKEITDSLRKLIEGPKKEKVKDEECDMSAIKMKAMKNVVNPMRHLHGLEERKNTPLSSEQEISSTNPTKKPTAKVSPIKKTPAKMSPKTVRTKVKENSHNVIVGKPLKQYTRPAKHIPKIERALTNPISLPSFDDDITQEPNKSTASREEMPEQPFKGFTAEEIKNSNLSLSNSDIDNSPIKKTKNKKLNEIQKLKISDEKLPQPTFKTTKTKTKKRKVPSPKKKTSNKKNRISKLSSESESAFDCKSSDNIDSDDDYKQYIPTENTHKLTEKTKGDVKDLVKYEINNIVIHADKDAPDLEIELIDQYTGSVCTDETEQSIETASEIDIDHDIVSETKNSEMETESVLANEEHGNIDEETIEVVRILTESEAAVIETKESLVLPRRKRKRPSLQSKLRKMGILPVANFYDDAANS